VSAADEMLTIEELCAEAKVSKQTIKRAMKDGRLHGTKLGPQALRFSRKDIDAWKRAGRR
jgi:excisionase family DNA binding protein